MDVHVDRARVVGIGLASTPSIAATASPRRPLARAAIRLPVVPGRGVHQRIGKQHADLRILGKPRMRRGHGVGVRLGKSSLVGRGIARVAGRKSVDQRPFALARVGGARLGVGHRHECRLHGAVFHRRIDVGAEHERLAPEAHGAARVQRLRLLERPLGFGVVEGIGQAQPLIEVALRHLVIRGDRMAQRAEALPQRRARGVVGAGLGGADQRQLHRLEGGRMLGAAAAHAGGDRARVEQLGYVCGRSRVAAGRCSRPERPCPGPTSVAGIA